MQQIFEIGKGLENSSFAAKTNINALEGGLLRF
jgi:hypothetical protein